MKHKYMAGACHQIKNDPITVQYFMKMKKLIFCSIALILMSVQFIQAQIQSQIGNGTSNGSTAGPIYQSGLDSMKARIVMLYTEEELAAANIFPGDTIKELAWFKSNDAVLMNGAISRLHFFQRSGLTHTEYISEPIMQDYIDTSLASGNGWAYIGTNEFSPNTTNWPSVTNWMPFTITPFVYSGGSLEIFIHSLIIRDFGNVSNKAITFRTLSGPRRVLYSGREPTPVLTFTSNASRANILITYARQTTRVRVNKIAEPEYICPGTYPVTVEVQNTGSVPVNSMEVRWMLNGVLQTPVQWNNTLDTIGGAGSDKAIITLHNNVSVTANSPIYIKAWGAMPNSLPVPVHPTDTLNTYIRAGLSGNYTIGGTNPDFPFVTDAVNELHKSGVCGPVVFNIRPGTYNGEMQIREIPNSSPLNTITFRSETGNANDVIIANPSSGSGNNYVMQLSNTHDIIFKRITLSQTGSSTLYTTVFSIGDTTDRITIDSCIITAPTSTSNSFGNALIAAKAGNVVANNYFGGGLVISNNTLRGGGIGILFQGTSSVILNGSDCIFDNNTIENFGNTGMYFQYTKNIKFRNNVVKANPSTTASTQYGVNVSNTYEQIEITGNHIYVPGGTGTTAQAHGIYFSTTYSSASNPTTVANNEIVIKGGPTASSAMGGIYATSSVFQNIYNNSVNVIGGSATNVYAGYFSYSGVSSNRIYNNVFANSSGGRALYVNLAVASNVMDYNNIYTSQPGGALVQKAFAPTGTYNSLASWRTASGLDRNSLSYRPGFVNDTTLRPNPNDAASWSLNGRGIHISGNANDIDGNPRSTLPLHGVPDIGAYEFIPAVLPPVALAVPATPATGVPQVFTFGEDTVAVITWNGTTIPASVDVRQYSGTKPPAYVSPDSMFFYADVAAGGGPYDYDAAIYYKEPWMGSIKAEPGLRLAEQTGGNPWQFYSGVASSVDTLRNRILKEQLTQPGLYTGTGEACAGQPQATVFVTPDITTPQCPGSVYTLTTRDPDFTSGITYQWQQAPSTAGPWTNVSGGSDPNLLYYTTPPVNSIVYYRVRSLCVNSGDSVVSTAFGIPVVPSAQMVSVTDGSRCGAGTVSLSAAGSPGATLYWYNDSTAGTLLDTGSTFETPVITTNTTYYVAASSNTKEERLASPTPGTSTVAPSAGQHLKFDVHTIATINTIDIYQRRTSGRRVSGGPLLMDSVRIFILNLQGDTVGRTPFYSFYADTTGITLEVLPVNITLAPGEYRITIRGTGAQLVRETSSNTNVSLDFPFETPSGAISVRAGGASLTSSNLLTTYQYLYNWSVSVPCESPRQAVTAILGTPPAFAVSATPVVCNNEVAILTVTSTPANFDSVTWTPVTGLYTNAAGTTPYTGGNAATVYARTSTPGRHTFVASAYNTTTACGNIDTVRKFVQPAQATATANPADICVNGSTTLRLDHAPDFGSGTIQWQSSPDGISYTDIPGSALPTYATGLLNTTSYYRAVLKNSDGAACINVPLTVTVNQTEVLSTNSVIRCGADSVTLTATGSPGSVLNWYNAISGGSLLDTGVSFTTPFLSSTTTFYVSSELGKRSHYIGRQYRTTAGTVSGSNDSGGLFFDAYVPFMLDSVAIYPVGTGTGTVTILLNTANGARLDSTTVTVTGTPAPGTKTFVPVQFNVPAGSLLLTVKRTGGGVTGLMRESVAPASNEIIFPYTIAGLASVIRGTGSSVITKTYPFLYDWKIYQHCESSRTPVTVTITQPPAFTAEALPANICIGDTTMLTATSANTQYIYEWTPGAYTGSNIPVAPANNTVYYVKALDNSGGINDGCVNYDSVIVSVNPLPPATVTSAGNTAFCEGDSVFLFANSGAGYSFQWQLNNTDITGAITSFIYAREDGAYTVKVTDINTCMTISDPEDVTVHPAPEPVIIPEGATLATGSFSSYQWYRNGTLIPGATNRQHTPEGDGNYTVMVRDANNCPGISEPYSFVVGVRNINNRPDIRVYPNPVSAMVYIESPVPVQVTLSSVDGKVVFHQKGVQQIDISSLSDAVYMIRVADLDGQVLHLSRLIKAAK